MSETNLLREQHGMEGAQKNSAVGTQAAFSRELQAAAEDAVYQALFNSKSGNRSAMKETKTSGPVALPLNLPTLPHVITTLPDGERVNVELRLKPPVVEYYDDTAVSATLSKASGSPAGVNKNSGRGAEMSVVLKKPTVASAADFPVF